MSQLYNRFGRIAAVLSAPLSRPLLNRSRRCRIIVINEDKQILLVRSWLSRQQHWTLPGGGIKRHETDAQGSARELTEESGIKLATEDFEILAEEAYPDTTNKLYFSVIYVKVQDVFIKDLNPRKFEIIDAKWFDIDKIPERRSPVVDAALRFI